MWPSGKAPVFGIGIAGSNPATPANFIMTKGSLLSLQNLNFSYTKLKLLNDISITIHNKDKIALIGKNGVGKSTFMQIIAKEKENQDGEIWFHPEIKIGYLKQKNYINSNLKVFDYLNSKMEGDSDKYKIKIFIKKLKLDESHIVSELSGGLKRKVFLAELLIKEPNLLLLDEPTNHLDVESIEWLEDFLYNEFNGVYLIVSHDRNFLKNTTNKVFWMDRGNIKVSPKGFGNFEEWSRNLIEHEMRALNNKNNFLKQELDWLSKGVKARRKRNERRKQNIIKLEEKTTKEKSDFYRSIKQVKINPPKYNELGSNIVLQFFNVSKSFFNEEKKLKLINNFSFKLSRGQKVGILGKNGIGKSTLLKLITKEIKPESGNIKLRDTVEISYFDQEKEQMNEKLSIKQNLIPNGGDYIDVNGLKQHICGYLKKFLFDPKSVDDIVSTLSGGQKNRLLLAKTLANPKQLLILDEPTNDLDLETLDVLTDFLKKYEGALMVSSHDRDFLDKISEKIIFFSGEGKIEISLDKCSDILRKNNKKDTVKKGCKFADEKAKEKKKEKPINLEKKIKQVLNKIENKENEMTKLSNEINLSKLYVSNPDKFFLVNDNIKKIQKELLALEEEWKDLEEKKITLN